MEDETRRQVWMCKWCGPHPDSSARWCAAGCGSDYNEMIDATIGAQRWGDYFRSLPVEERAAALNLVRAKVWGGEDEDGDPEIMVTIDGSDAPLDPHHAFWIESHPLPAGREKK